MDNIRIIDASAFHPATWDTRAAVASLARYIRRQRPDLTTSQAQDRAIAAVIGTVKDTP